MLIKSLELRNIKSYADGSETISFQPGVNLICGANGSGKTTILEAIGYALFGALDYKLEHFRREGASSGEIILTFLSSVDDRTYQVVCRIGKSATFYIYDPETKRRLTQRKEDVVAWLSDHIGVEAGYARKLFLDAIGVPQGKMTGTFLESDRARKGVFDSLLRVEEYETAWRNLSRTASYLNGQLGTAREEVARLEGQLERLPDVQHQIEQLEEKIRADNDELSDVEQRLTAFRQELSALDEQKGLLDDLARRLNEAEHELIVIRQKVGTASDDLREAEEAARIVAESAAGFEAYQEAQRRLDELEGLRAERNRQVEELRQIERDLAGVDSTLKHLEDQLTDVAHAERRVLELAPLVEEQMRHETRVAEAKERVARHQRAREEIEKADQFLASLREKMETLRQQLNERDQVEASLSQSREKRTVLTTQLNELNEQLSPLEEQRSEVEGALRAAEREKHEWETLRATLTKEQETLERYRAEQAEVETKLREREQIQQELATIAEETAAQQTRMAAAQADQKQYKTALDNLQERLTLLRSAEAAECPVCKSPLDDHRAGELESEFERECERLRSERAAAKRVQQEARQTLEALERRQREQQAVLETLPAPGRAEELRRAIADQQTTVERCHEQLAALAGAAERLQAKQNELAALDRRLADLKAQRAALERERTTLDHEMDQLSRRLATLPQPEQADELEDQIRQVSDERAGWQAQADALAGAAEELESAQTALAALGDPRQEQASQRAIAGRRPRLEAEREAAQARRAELTAQVQARKEALEAFATLEADWEATRARRQANEEAYRRYTANESLARTCDERRSRLEEAKREEAEKLAERDTLAERHAQARQTYDAGRHQEVRVEAEDADKKIVELKTRLAGLQAQLQTAQDELAELLQRQKKLDAARAEVDRLNRLSEVFRFVRDGIRRAGPAVVQRRVKAISDHADQIFQEIIEDPALRLRWDETYAISVRHKDEDRVFNQLSGGEQMAAAIAVRLALLMQMSEVRTLFLDEPTANLDDKRREKLADRITRLEGLRQIFVITHDDAFERDSHHVIYVRKENGRSLIEVG